MRLTCSPTYPDQASKGWLHAATQGAVQVPNTAAVHASLAIANIPTVTTPTASLHTTTHIRTQLHNACEGTQPAPLALSLPNQTCVLLAALSLQTLRHAATAQEMRNMPANHAWAKYTHRCSRIDPAQMVVSDACPAPDAIPYPGTTMLTQLCCCSTQYTLTQHRTVPTPTHTLNSNNLLLHTGTLQHTLSMYYSSTGITNSTHPPPQH
jgi:hypothetical protein